MGWAENLKNTVSCVFFGVVFVGGGFSQTFS